MLPQIEISVKKHSLAVFVAIVVLLCAGAVVSAQTSAAAPASAVPAAAAPAAASPSFPTATPITGNALAEGPTVSRTTRAVHYRLQGGSAKVDFHGTDLLQGATGEARVEGKKPTSRLKQSFRTWKTRPSSGWSI